ncbi:MAG: Bug family tripartite tricarboxylate transporter substrate binding protein [Betaproteobacteria bacterium]
MTLSLLRRGITCFAVLGLALGALSKPASAHSYPNKPVHDIVTFPPGGTPDIYGRLLSQELSTLWKQSVVVENKTGASGTIGTDFVAKAAPDGYTLLFAADASITIAPNLVVNTPYNPVRDLTAIVNVAAGPFIMLAHPAFPVSDLPALIEAARRQPGKITYASSGSGGQQHLSMEVIKQRAGIDIVHIPYKGFGQGIQDVMAGHVPLIFGGITASIQLSKSGKLKPIATTGPKRARVLPDVPAVAETLPGFRIEAWYGFMGPANMPRELVAKIHADVMSIANRPDFQARIIADGMEPVAGSPESFSRQVADELRDWGEMIRSAKIKAD